MHRKRAKVWKFLRFWWKQIALIAISGCLFAGGLFFLWVISLDIPSFDTFHQRQITESTKIYDRTGEIVLYDVFENVKRQVVPFEEISQHLKDATLAIEDDKFYSHHGVRPAAILRSIFGNILKGERPAGGSTITQQLIKNTVLTQDRTISRKLKELVLSLKLEQVMSKNEILSLYLNETPYGGSVYGAEEAAQSYFGKPAKDLSVAESAYIAAMAKAPTYYSPYGQHRDRLDARKDLVLGRMRELGYISPTEENAAKAEKVVFLSQNNSLIKAPHFVMYVRDYLEAKYGAENVRNKGYKVITTLDWNLQQKAETIVRQYGEENVKNYNAKNAGMVAVDPKTGQILMMVGSKDYFDTKNEGNFNVTLAHRQPGSSFKPFVYATAFNKGFTSETAIFDLPTQFDTACTGNSEQCYTPSNYDDKFRGPMTFRTALAQSINIPAIKVLYLAGIKDSIATARSMGITSLESASRYGLTLVLGGGEVSPLEMTAAYGVFANDGVRNPATAILKVTDAQGNVLEEFKPNPEQVLPQNSARQISDILSDNQARQPSYAANSPLYFPGRQVAAKTGTTNDYKDAWILGYTPSISVGAWVGNNDNTPMEKRVAGFIVAPMWNAFMKEALATLPNETFPKPDKIDDTLPPYYRGFWQGGKSFFTDKISGKLATEYTPADLKEEHVITQVHSILYWLGKTNDGQFKLWEGPVRAWAASQGYNDQSESIIPTITDDVHTPAYAPKFNISSPVAGGTYKENDSVTVQINGYEGRYPMSQLDVYLNDQYLGSVNRAPFQLSFRPSDTDNFQEQSQLRVVVYDSVRNRTEETIALNITPAE